MFDNIDSSALFASVFWGGIATGFVVYGWRQKTLIPFLTGVALTVVSYFLLSSALYMSLACMVILGIFIWAKKRGY